MKHKSGQCTRKNRRLAVKAEVDSINAVFIPTEVLMQGYCEQALKSSDSYK